ncbi:MAG: SatD family protein [Chitinophagales bacterium]|nr:SatD family protein [Chitinophagales bacterium]
MIAVITGDIIASRKLVNQEKWLLPLKNLLTTWGSSPKDWKIDRGDFFQIEITNAEEALKKALEIKALIKKVEPLDERKKISTIDVRLAIGVGEKTYLGESISESNGTAFINSGEKFDLLRKDNLTIGIKTPWKDIDEEINLYLRLVGIFMDKWSVSSAELMQIILNNPTITQEEIGKKLGIQQSGVSRRWNRANVNELLEVEKIFRKKINMLIK